ncbi:MAG: hypothetical protein AABX86_02490 [Nanoarchaeota archaeon]
MYEAWKLKKPIYLLNPIPEGILTDEIKAMQPIILHGDLSPLEKIAINEKMKTRKYNVMTTREIKGLDQNLY